eukprot:CAMPEP_0202880234 /NCGR_PEP_ID=MMETSP1391-20130828/34809_1 /ASSEMBLY_ACC=CAM_ASM_000867 /TAXON_ID=1034604 /ORGANISM="Chlamydomonas leiostraca, Strain SAG 11-49" /LENGTH=66 /DNA_ID=CAMNT_0049562711 /DNA_START=429 /DNA_END=626 /DNA_ORIENTATION=+
MCYLCMAALPACRRTQKQLQQPEAMGAQVTSRRTSHAALALLLLPVSSSQPAHTARTRPAAHRAAP